jgi:hypothetical protein
MKATAGTQQHGTVATEGTPETLELTDFNSRAFSLSKISGTLTAVRITRVVGPTAAQDIFGTAGNANKSRIKKLVET